MDTLTREEWHATLSALEREIRYYWDAVITAYGCNRPEFVPNWIVRLEAAKRVYDRVFLLPISDDQYEEGQYEEPYEPVYQEPDSFYTYEPRQDSWE